MLAKITATTLLLALTACGLPVGPAGERSPASSYNPVSMEVNQPGR